ncbi:DgyrCDS14547 [Dimorphilus gyrociliatus]|uniref:DgyrCDS14547 n=1 Tax=Dimorphilus gyrociliatus TaxID=2664684 RepID=A0A7I8WE03_9ANNE|nr:DgyrCDS14547 [Dimorphilus gyrociliatus]
MEKKRTAMKIMTKTFAFLLFLLEYCNTTAISLSRLNFDERIASVKVEWSSGFTQVVNLSDVAGFKMYCFKYTNTPDIESGLNLVIKDVYIDETVGFQYVNVFTKGMNIH